MKKSTLAATILLVANLSTASAAEITTCIIDTTIKSNPVLYYFPITATKLRCDHEKNNASVTLSELYEANWRLIQVISPVRVDQKDKKTAYTPPVLYLERDKTPASVTRKGDAPESPSSYDSTEEPAEATTKNKGGGLFNWLQGDTQQGTVNE